MNKNMRNKMMIGAGIFIATFLVLAIVTPAFGQQRIEFGMGDIYDDDIAPDLIERGTIEGRIELLDSSLEVVEAVDYLTRDGYIIEILPQALTQFSYLGKNVSWVRIIISWYIPSANIEWDWFEVKSELYFESYDTIISTMTSQSTVGTFRYPDMALGSYFNVTESGPQTAHFQAIVVLQGEILVDGQLGSFNRRFVEDVPVTVSAAGIEIEVGQEYDDIGLTTHEDSLADSELIYTTELRVDGEIISEGLDYNNPGGADLMSLFSPNGSLGIDPIQQILLLAGIITVIIIILSEKGTDIVKDLLRQIKKTIPKLGW